VRTSNGAVGGVHGVRDSDEVVLYMTWQQQRLGQMAFKHRLVAFWQNARLLRLRPIVHDLIFLAV